MKAVSSWLCLGLSLTAPLAACSGASTREESARSTQSSTVSGELAMAEYGLSAPSIVAQSANGAFYVAPVDAQGRFDLTLPGAEVYRLSIVRGTRGAFVPVSRIRTPAGDSLWTRIDGNAQIELGLVRPAEASLVKKDRGRDHPEDDDGGVDDSLDDDAGVADSGDDHGGNDDDGDDDDCARACVPGGERDADLPYDVKLALGDTFQLSDAFLEKGPKPSAIVRVTMEGTPHRLSELQADAPFVVEALDCSHAGNRDTGRDRVFVTWQNADGSLETDHLDLRYCEASGKHRDSDDDSDEGSDDDSDDGDDDQCEPGEVPSPVCHDDSEPPISDCHGGSSDHMQEAEAPSADPEPGCEPTDPPSGGEPPATDPPVMPPPPPPPAPF